MSKKPVETNSRISSLFGAVAQVIVYLLALLLIWQAFLAVGFNEQIAAAGASCITCLLCLVAYGVQRKSLHRDGPNTHLVMWCAAFAGGLCVAVLSYAFARLTGFEQAVDLTAVNVVGYGFAAPIAEEALYRGIVLNRVEQGYGPTFALVLSSALFAVAHMQPIRMVLAFAFGLLLGFVYQKGRSLPMVMLMHVVANTFMFVIVFAIPESVGFLS